MGYSLCWAAVRGKSRDAVLAELELKATGATESLLESPLAGAQASEWYVVASSQDVRFSDEAVLAKLSAGCEVVTCFIEEHVMCSSAYGWRDGKEIWWINHESPIAPDHLEVTGEPPAVFAEIRDRLRAQQDDDEPDDKFGATDHIFNIPIDLAKAVTGFDHEEDREHYFEVLASTKPPPAPKKSWLARLLQK